jgi:hypothetical protein
MNGLRKFRAHRAKMAVVAGVWLGLGCLQGIARAADQTVTAQELAAICAQTACRTEKIITLRAPGDNIARFKTDPVPYVYKGSVTIYPDEIYAVRMRVRGKELGDPMFERGSEGKPLPGPTGYRPEAEAKAVRDTASTPVEGLVYFSFKQQEGTGMMLEIVSTLPVTVKYDAVMFVATPGGIQPDRTSSCPVFGGAAAIEKWPVPLTMLALSNFRIIAGGNQACQ